MTTRLHPAVAGGGQMNMVRKSADPAPVADYEAPASTSVHSLDTLTSPRESEGLAALVAGRPNKVIAFDLGIRVRTVKVHRARA